MTVHLPVIVEGQDACSICRGECCKMHPGSSAPDQWWGEDSPDWDRIEAALLDGSWVIDSAFDRDGNGTTFYLRPATGDSDSVFDTKIRMTKGYEKCVFLSESGCRLGDSDRPTECRSLSAKVSVSGSKITEYHCSHPGGHGTGRVLVVKAWRQYSEKLELVGLVALEQLQQRKAI